MIDEVLCGYTMVNNNEDSNARQEAAKENE
jgi:hypothetical protein